MINEFVSHSVVLMSDWRFLASFLCSCCRFIFFLLRKSPHGEEAYYNSVVLMISVSCWGTYCGASGTLTSPTSFYIKADSPYAVSSASKTSMLSVMILSKVSGESTFEETFFGLVDFALAVGFTDGPEELGLGELKFVHRS